MLIKKTRPFVKTGSIVREIWGNADTILFIFAGAAAEFAANKAVDWLYYTGKLPSDPLNRLFSTVVYARKIVFSDFDGAHSAIDQITAIHQSVENKRGAKIPDWAYRDVLYMLIDYSIRSYELLERKLTNQEKQEIFEVFQAVGSRMQIAGLPNSLAQWEQSRQAHLENNLLNSQFTTDLYQQYRKHLGAVRYYLLRHVQSVILPKRVLQVLKLPHYTLIRPLLLLYQFLKKLHLGHHFRNALLPIEYRDQIVALDGY